MPIALTAFEMDLLASGLKHKHPSLIKTIKASVSKGRLAYTFKGAVSAYVAEEILNKSACEILGLRDISLTYADFLAADIQINPKDMIDAVHALNNHYPFKYVANFDYEPVKGIPRINCKRFEGVMTFGKASDGTGGLVGGFREAYQDLVKKTLGNDIDIERACAPFVVSR